MALPTSGAIAGCKGGGGGGILLVYVLFFGGFLRGAFLWSGGCTGRQGALASLRFGLDGSIREAGEGFFGWVWVSVCGVGVDVVCWPFSVVWCAEE